LRSQTGAQDRASREDCQRSLLHHRLQSTRTAGIFINTGQTVILWFCFDILSQSQVIVKRESSVAIMTNRGRCWRREIASIIIACRSAVSADVKGLLMIVTGKG